jgi:hypothetical protein
VRIFVAVQRTIAEIVVVDRETIFVPRANTDVRGSYAESVATVIDGGTRVFVIAFLGVGFIDTAERGLATVVGARIVVVALNRGIGEAFSFKTIGILGTEVVIDAAGVVGFCHFQTDSITA